MFVHNYYMDVELMQYLVSIFLLAQLSSFAIGFVVSGFRKLSK